MNRELICIRCPKGCHLVIDDNLNVSGNGCIRGKEYAISELTNPTRNISSTVVVLNGELLRLPVKTNKPIKKELIFKCMELINQVRVTAPIKVNDVIISNILNSGVDIVACRSCEVK